MYLQMFMWSKLDFMLNTFKRSPNKGTVNIVELKDCEDAVSLILDPN